MPNSLLINLSFLIDKPTGLSVYAQNLLPYLKDLQPTLLSAQQMSGFDCRDISASLNSSQGKKGHFNRLLWTQFQVPKIYQQLHSSLFFSPIPESPLYSNCQSIVVVHDLIPLRFPNAFSPLTAYFKYYVPQVLKQAKHIICNSQSTANDIIDYYQIPAHKITPTLLAFDNQNFREIKTEEPEPNHPYFLYIGRPDPHKNLARLVAAFAQISQAQTYELWLIGSPDPRYTPSLKHQAQELGIGDRVKFLDYVAYDKLPVIINQAVSLVFPSLWEGFGLPVLEAMACGTPVITSDISALPEVAGEAALLVNPYNTQEITAAMESLISNNQLRQKLKDLGLKRAHNFSWKKTGKQTAEILQKFL